MFREDGFVTTTLSIVSRTFNLRASSALHLRSQKLLSPNFKLHATRRKLFDASFCCLFRPCPVSFFIFAQGAACSRDRTPAPFRHSFVAPHRPWQRGRPEAQPVQKKSTLHEYILQNNTEAPLLPPTPPPPSSLHINAPRQRCCCSIRYTSTHTKHNSRSGIRSAASAPINQT